MKILILTLVFLSTSYASAQELSPKMAGLYQLDREATDAKYYNGQNKYYQCPDQAKVTEVQREGYLEVFIEPAGDLTKYSDLRGYWSSKSISGNAASGDTGPRNDQYVFNANEVSDTRREVGIVGYISAYSGIHRPFYNKNKLIFKRKSTAVPAGLILSDDSRLECTFRQIK